MKGSHRDFKKITIAIPVLNEENNLEKCLSKIYEQNYPKHLIEVIIVDAGSTDRTLEIAKRFPTKILFNKKMKDPESGKMIALKKATGEFFVYLDADMFLMSHDWLKKMLFPFNDKRVSGTFTRFVVVKDDKALNRYLSYDTLQRDPLYKFLTASLEDIIVEKAKGFYLCKLRLNNPPPVGLCICRTALLKKFFKKDRLIDLEVPLRFLIEGYGYFAYVPTAGIHHLHAKSIKNLLKKRIRNIDQMNKGKSGYIPDFENRLFKWIDITKKSNLIKLALWVIYANLFFPLFISGIYKAIKHRDVCFFLEPIIGMLVTDAILWGFIRNQKGRRIMLGLKK